MLTLNLLFWATLAAALISFWWQSDKIKSVALQVVTQHCKQQGLQLLDQTMVLSGLWPIRADSGTLSLRRRYAFEFTSTGQERYKGSVELQGRQLSHFALAPHILPDESD
jgi:hypothetical protein